MKRYENAAGLAKDIGVPVSNLDETFKQYVAAATGKIKDPYHKVRFVNFDYTVDDVLHVI